MNLTWQCSCPNEIVFRKTNAPHVIDIQDRCPMCGLSNTEVSEMLALFGGAA